MIVLATSTSGAEVNGDRIVAWIKSGDDNLEIALTPNQALLFAHSLTRAAGKAITNSQPTAELITLHKPKAARRRAKQT